MKNADMPAMPIPLNEGKSFVECGKADGLTKREVMAMAAMQGLCTHGGYHTYSDMAHDAVVCADALLAELAKGAAS